MARGRKLLLNRPRAVATKKAIGGETIEESSLRNNHDEEGRKEDFEYLLMWKSLEIASGQRNR